MFLLVGLKADCMQNVSFIGCLGVAVLWFINPFFFGGGRGGDPFFSLDICSCWLKRSCYGELQLPRLRES